MFIFRKAGTLFWEAESLKSTMICLWLFFLFTKAIIPYKLSFPAGFSPKYLLFFSLSFMN